MKVPSFLLEKLSQDELWQVIKWLREINFPEFVLEEAVKKAFGANEEIDPNKPLFYRDCPDCVFLGNYMGKSLYYCTEYGSTVVQAGHHWAAVREYSEDDEWYIEAENRATLRDFLPGLAKKGLNK